MNLTVLVTKDGFALKQQAELTDEPEAPIPKRSFMVKGQEHVDYDYPTLYNRVRQKKIEHPDETTVNVGAEMAIPWQIIARTIDATRVVLEADSYENLEKYNTAKPKMGKDTNNDGMVDPVDMFPAVVFVVAE